MRLTKPRLGGVFSLARSQGLMAGSVDDGAVHPGRTRKWICGSTADGHKQRCGVIATRNPRSAARKPKPDGATAQSANGLRWIVPLQAHEQSRDLGLARKTAAEPAQGLEFVAGL